MKKKYYDVEKLVKRYPDSHYYVIIGERSNGKTYSVLKYMLTQSVKTNTQFAVIRRWQDDFKGQRGATMFDALEDNFEIEDITDGQWTNVEYKSNRWYLCRYDDDGKKTVAEEPIGYAFAISSMEHDKSTSYPKVNHILFDEFLTRQLYLPNEFVLFMNTLSTIIRQRNNVKIFMCGNTVNQYSPYFSEMGLTHIKQMKPGDVELYKYGDSALQVVVEFSDNPNKKKDSDVYFAFNNSHLNMITKGEWDMDIYPHCPHKYYKEDVLFTYFIQYDGELLQAEIVLKEDVLFTFIHRKTTELQDPEHDIIFTPEYNSRPNYNRRITHPTNNITKKISHTFNDDSVFYQDNEVGEIVRNYIHWCLKK